MDYMSLVKKFFQPPFGFPISLPSMKNGLRENGFVFKEIGRPFGVERERECAIVSGGLEYLVIFEEDDCIGSNAQNANRIVLIGYSFCSWMERKFQRKTLGALEISTCTVVCRRSGRWIRTVDQDALSLTFCLRC
ncbi:hypothetical protein HAX54_009033 [Datura stramonium]|uniref:Uncharacterized protein n=1 Tax=Datura stramonium TaxID=4076 RepID=A0ABS8TFM3_DATST|nr:hypothetical protein [Datura stramonium]